MVRDAGKNFTHIVVIVSPEKDWQILHELKKYGDVSIETKSALSIEAYKKTAKYDIALHKLLLSLRN